MVREDFTITEKALPEGSVELGDLYLVEAGLDPVEVPAHPVHGETLGRAQPRVDHAPDVGEAVPGHLASVDPANEGFNTISAVFENTFILGSFILRLKT